MKNNILSSDKLGALTGSLCIIHCLATPLLFLVGSCVGSCHDLIPFWWSSFEFVFVGIAFLAIYQSTRVTTSAIIKPVFWVNWVAICFAIFNEKMHWVEIPEYFIFIPTSILIITHIYNLKFCSCQSEEDSCCVKESCN